MPTRRLGRCDGHHKMVDCIGPLGAPEKIRPSRIGTLLGHWWDTRRPRRWHLAGWPASTTAKKSRRCLKAIGGDHKSKLLRQVDFKSRRAALCRGRRVK